MFLQTVESSSREFLGRDSASALAAAVVWNLGFQL